MRRVVAPLFLVVIVAGCGNFAGGDDDENEEDFEAVAESRVRAVEAVELTEGRLGGEVRVFGRIRGTREATVISETQGQIESVHFDLGDRIEAGEVLVRLPDRTEEFAVEQARAQLETAESELESVESRRERGSASSAELSGARGNVFGAQQQLAQAEEAYENRTIRAPISGNIASIGQSVGEGDYLSSGTTVTRVVNMDRARLNASVGRRQVNMLEPGQPATVHVTDCRPEFEATVHSVSAGADEQTGSFAVAIEWDTECPTEELRSGLSAEATVQTGEGTQGIIVPTAALRSRVGETAGGEGATAELFVLEDGTAVSREVVIAERLGARAVASSGVEAGELVAVSGVSRLRDGDTIEAQRIGTSGEIE